MRVRLRDLNKGRLRELGQTVCVTHPRATVNKLDQHTGHVVGAQQAVDHTDAKRQKRNQQMNRTRECLDIVLTLACCFDPLLLPVAPGHTSPRDR